MIKLHIKCNNNDEQSEALNELGIDAPKKTEYRPFKIRPELIDGFYPDPDGGCFVMAIGSELTVRESFNELEKLLS